jgi:hypothetical protein
MKRTTFGPRRPKPQTAKRAICPLLGTMDQHGATAPPIDYPSFENCCLATHEADQIILTEQATFCLSAAHRTCPRFIAAAAANPERVAGESPALEDVAREPEFYPLQNVTPGAGASTAGFADIASFDESDEDGYSPEESAARRQKWSWIGAAMIFVSVLMCGGIFAVYVGWQIANTSYVASPPGSVDTLSSAAQPQIYLVVTATSEPQTDAVAAAQNPAEQPQAATGENQPAQAVDPGQLPQAVTPTPMSAGPGGSGPNGQDGTSQDSAADNLTGQGPQDPGVNNPDNGEFSQPQTEQPESQQPPVQQPQAQDPSLDALQLEIPTRRPTPVLDIPTSTPMPPNDDVQITEPISVEPPPPQGTPMVLFSAADDILQSGECTTITWNVENVRAVYFDSHGVDGQGEREVCMRDRTSNYVLTVMHLDGNPHYFTQTIEYLAPTPTPTPTYTFTPEPELTPTWTPIPPTSTPTPDIQYGVHLASQSGQTVACTPDSECEVNLMVTNSGSDIDNIAVELSNSGAWSAQICRPDGVCGSPSLLLSGMGPGNTALVRLLVQVPSLEATQDQNYVLRALSEGSGKTIGSNPLQITLEADP